jgi:hypothetical protein
MVRKREASENQVEKDAACKIGTKDRATAAVNGRGK